MFRHCLQIFHDRQGAAAIETAIVAPVLALMAIGTFELGTMFSRQQELQSAASEVEGIVLAAVSGTGTDSTVIEDIIKGSLDPNETRDSLEVSLEQRFRCDTAETLTTSASGCDPESPIYQYIILEITDRYSPIWTNYGFSRPYEYNVTRTIQIQ